MYNLDVTDHHKLSNLFSATYQNKNISQSSALNNDYYTHTDLRHSFKLKACFSRSETVFNMSQLNENPKRKVDDSKSAGKSIIMDSMKKKLKQVPRYISKNRVYHKDPPAEIELFVLGTGAHGSPKSLLVIMNAFR